MFPRSQACDLVLASSSSLLFYPCNSFILAQPHGSSTWFSNTRHSFLTLGHSLSSPFPLFGMFFPQIQEWSSLSLHSDLSSDATSSEGWPWFYLTLSQPDSFLFSAFITHLLTFYKFACSFIYYLLISPGPIYTRWFHLPLSLVDPHCTVHTVSGTL